MQKNNILINKLDYYITWSEIQDVIYDFRKYTLRIDLLRKDDKSKIESNYHSLEFLEVSNFCSFENYESFDYKESLYFNDFYSSGDKNCTINIISNNNKLIEKKNINVYLEIGECSLYLKANKLRINDEEFILK